MYVRYVTRLRDVESRQFLGVVRSVSEWEDLIDLDDLDLLNDLIAWFNDWLRIPARFTRSRRRSAARRAICWFRASANDHIAKAQAMSKIFQRNGIDSPLLETKKPGYIVYEDRFQVTAIPFRDTF